MKRSTRNLQWGARKGAWWAGYGDRHEIWTTGLLTRWTCLSAGRVVIVGCGGQMWGQTRNLSKRTFGPVDLTKRRPGGRGGLGAQIWGQARCPIYRSGTFNVKRSTLNF